MFSVRKVKTRSGSTAVQVVRYVGHKAIIFRHIGSSKDETELTVLLQSAADSIEENTAQLSLFADQKQKLLVVNRGECIGVTHYFAYQFFMRYFEECGLSHLSRLLLDLSIMRLVEPASKLRSIELLQHYFDIKYSQRIYCNITKLTDYKSDIEQCAYKVAQEKFNEPFYFVLYDVTTLYFESFMADELKTQRFSKDNKSLQPQIAIGLLVTQSGFPLSYQVFVGNTFERKTMIPVLEGFISTHPQSRPIIVADAAMLDDERLAELRQRKLSYIVGARLPKTKLTLVRKIHAKLNGNHGAMARFTSMHGDLVCDFSLKRYKKELIELNKLIQKDEELVAKQELKIKVRFIRKVAKEKIELNTELIEKRRLLLSIKVNYTDLPKKLLSNEMVIERYRQLWHVEQLFRMS